MTNTLSIKASIRNAMLDVLADAADAGAGAGTLEIRSGTRPANADATETGTLLVTFTLADPGFDPAASGSVAIDAAPDLTATAAASGTATWGRLKDSDGNTVCDGDVGTSGSVFNITSTTVVSGQTVTLTSGTFSLAA